MNDKRLTEGVSVLSERLTKFVTPVGKCITTLNSMKHYMPCVTCRNNAKIKTDVNGEQYTEKFNFCDTCEAKMLFNRLKEYEDLEEQGLLLRLPCKVGDTVYAIFISGFNFEKRLPIYEIFEVKIIRFIQDSFTLCFEVMTEDKQKSEYAVSTFGEYVFPTQSEAEEKLREMEGK